MQKYIEYKNQQQNVLTKQGDSVYSEYARILCHPMHACGSYHHSSAETQHFEVIFMGCIPGSTVCLSS